MNSNPELLSLNDIHKDHPGLTATIAAHLLEGCAVTLFRKKHPSGKSLLMQGDVAEEWPLDWSVPVDARTERAWKDQDYATEHGAVCLAILITDRLTGKKVIERSVKKTGFDYWVGEVNEGEFQGLARLEVSGIFTGSEGKLRRRFRKKVKQTGQSDALGLDAYISVTEFHELKSIFFRKK